MLPAAGHRYSGEVAAGTAFADAVFGAKRAAADGGDRIQHFVPLVILIQAEEFEADKPDPEAHGIYHLVGESPPKSADAH
jgi:hypothetical protein